MHFDRFHDTIGCTTTKYYNVLFHGNVFFQSNMGVLGLLDIIGIIRENNTYLVPIRSSLVNL